MPSTTLIRYLYPNISGWPWPLGSREVITQRVSPAIFKIIGTRHIGVTTFTFLCHVTSSVTWPFYSSGAICYRCSIVTESLSPVIFEIMGPKHTGVTNLTFLGHETSSVTWPIDSPGAISYRCSIVKEFVSPAIFEIMGPKDIWVTTLTFLGHVIGHVTNRSAICHCYWCTIGTEPLSLTVFEIFGPQYPWARARIHQHAENRKTPQVILYSVPCNVLHWTDKNITVTILLSPRCNCAAIIQTNKRVSFRFCWVSSVSVHTRKPSWRWQTRATQKDAKLLQSDVFRFISPNSISPNFKLPEHSFTRYV